MKENIKIIVVTHKLYDIPHDSLYSPIMVGKKDVFPDNFLKDDLGDNISSKNFSYCELTALYWAWKNLDFEYLGLCHYRRYFKGNKKIKINNKIVRILSESDVNTLIKNYDVILPKKRKYFIETNESQYLHAHHKEGLYEAYNVIREFYPNFTNALNKVMSRTYGHRYNMFIMKKELLDEYLTWLFDILERVQCRICIDNWSASEQRVFGYLSERLLDVWIEYKGIKYKEIKVVYTESQHILKKGIKFVYRKFRKK